MVFTIFTAKQTYDLKLKAKNLYFYNKIID